MGGSSRKQVVGYKYKAGMHLIISLGPIDSIEKLWYGDKVAWESPGGRVMDEEIYIDAPNLFGDESAEGGIQGYVDVLGGLPSQDVNPYLAEKLNSPLVPAYRGMCSLVAKAVYWGNNRYPKALKVMASRILTRCSSQTTNYLNQWNLSTAAIQTSDSDPKPLDMNPAHIIREMLTEEWGRGLPESMIGGTFSDASTRLYDEKLGLSFLFTKETPVNEMVGEVLRHIDGVLYEDPFSGLLELKLIRDDYNISELPVANVGVTGVLDNANLTKLDRSEISELVNQVTVSYRDRKSGESSSITVQDAAAIGMIGRVVSQTNEYAGASCSEVAKTLAERDIARISRQRYSGTIELNREFYELRPGDAFILKAPLDGIEQMVCRVAKRSESEFMSGVINVSFVEDVFGAGWTTYAKVPDSGWVSPIGTPQNFRDAFAFEAPFVFASGELGRQAAIAIGDDVGYYCLAGATPQTGAHINYLMWSYNSSQPQPTNPSLSTTENFTPFTTVTSDASELDTTIYISGLDRSSSITAGTIALVRTASQFDEFVSIESFTQDSIVVKRGVIDTLPKPIPAGSAIFVVGVNYGLSTSQWAAGEVVRGYGAPTNLSGVYAGPFTFLDVEIDGRIARPYPPAAIRYNGDFIPLTIHGALTISWAHRDRVGQSDQLIGWFNSDNFGPEAGVTYTIRIYDEDGILVRTESGLTVNEYVYSDEIGDLGKSEYGIGPIFSFTGSPITPEPRLNGNLRIEMETERGGVVSLEHTDKTIIRSGWGYSWDESWGE